MPVTRVDGRVEGYKGLKRGYATVFGRLVRGTGALVRVKGISLRLQEP